MIKYFCDVCGQAADGSSTPKSYSVSLNDFRLKVDVFLSMIVDDDYCKEAHLCEQCLLDTIKKGNSNEI